MCDSSTRGSDRIQCPVCGKSLSPRTDMVRHSRLHVSPEERAEFMHPCPFPNCTYQSLQKSNVVTHCRTHTQDKSQICPEEACGFSTCDPGSLTRHRKVWHNYQPKARNFLGQGGKAPKAPRKRRQAVRHAPYRVERSASCESDSSVSSSSSASSTSSSTDSVDATSWPYLCPATSASSSQSSLSNDVKDFESLSVNAVNVPSPSPVPDTVHDWRVPMTHDQGDWQLSFDQLCSREPEVSSGSALYPAASQTGASWEPSHTANFELPHLLPNYTTVPNSSSVNFAAFPDALSKTSSWELSCSTVPGMPYSSLSTDLHTVPDDCFARDVVAPSGGSSGYFVDWANAPENIFLGVSDTFSELSSAPTEPDLSLFLERVGLRSDEIAVPVHHSIEESADLLLSSISALNSFTQYLNEPLDVSAFFPY